jgi:hypothetical protein
VTDGSLQENRRSHAMRTFILAGAVTLALGGTAFAHMCGAPQQSGATAQASGTGCGMMRQIQADDPMADKPANKGMMGGMMCPCCKNMASMGGMKQDGDAQPKHDMPMPKQ